MEDLKKSLSRQTDNYTKSRDLYLGPAQSPMPNEGGNTKLKNSSQVE